MKFDGMEDRTLAVQLEEGEPHCNRQHSSNLLCVVAIYVLIFIRYIVRGVISVTT